MIAYGIITILVLAFLPDGIISLIGKNLTEIKEMFKERMKVFKDDRKKTPNKKAKV